ncbi:MAG: 16S rRNA (cytosine1402-N4)-methyltransferase [Halieaceae bacterium]|jgi:16S rRNA (cytosine1402-N4)-methyltransferase
MHESVLLQEAVAALVMKPDGCYVDGTFGRGGHSRRILNSLTGGGSLLAVDRDRAALSEAEGLMAQDKRFAFIRASFSELPGVLADRGMQQIDGLLLDLGVSSPQLDDASRGFSFLRDGPLDMRMDEDSGVSAADWLATAAEAEIARVLWEYGEERFSRRIARAIVSAREEAPITRTSVLSDIVSVANPAWERHKHPATRSFQAIRIHVNRELDELATALDQSLAMLTTGGRLVVLSFHSLEDRLVKRFMRRMADGDKLPSHIPVRDQDRNRKMKLIGKAGRASQAEVQENVRARSVVMRVAEKL